jgi:hypothetical protein
MDTLRIVIACLVGAAILWFAYKVGKIVLRILAGLLFLGALGYGIWYFFLRQPPPL